MNRYYSATTGRFYSPDLGAVATADPTDPGRWNRYAYMQGGPVNLTDRPGLLRHIAEAETAPDCDLDITNAGEPGSGEKGSAMNCPVSLPEKPLGSGACRNENSAYLESVTYGRDSTDDGS